MFCIVLTLIGLIMSVRCTVSVRTRSYLHYIGVPCMCWVFIMFVWCTVDVFSLRSPIAGSFSSLAFCHVLCACCHGLRCTARPSVGLLQLPPLNYSVFSINQQ